MPYLIYLSACNAQHFGNLKMRPSEYSLADFCTSALLKAVRINLLAKVQKSAREFSHGFDLSRSFVFN